MKVYLAADHAGFKLKEKVKEFLQKEGYETEDCGAFEYDKSDDFTDFISKAAHEVSLNPENKAIIFGASGQGEAILANKYPNVRAVVFYTPCKVQKIADISGRKSDDPFEMVRLTREHNNSNILSLGARFLSEEDVLTASKLWLDTLFPGEERHLRRIEKIKQIELIIK